ncbi:MAG TPA: Crp/Fnr family transcriptional regulator [Candidatus Saccharimonadales bacterium]|nr:Crp/Fnr family transcriptional regulator [Candidatus Saccharimonadales bacterium]
MLASEAQNSALVDLFRREGNKLTYKKGEFVIRPGQAPTGVFYISSGIVKAFDITKYGEDNMLIIRKEKEIFPLIWAVTGEERHIIYETLSDTILYQISRDKFVKHMRNNPEILTPLLDMVTEMYRIHSERILNLEYRSVRERVISFLIAMSNRFSRPAAKGVTIDVPLRRQDIASSINATRETTSREMVYLEKHGLVSNKNTYITLIDIDKLQSFL